MLSPALSSDKTLSKTDPKLRRLAMKCEPILYSWYSTSWNELGLESRQPFLAVILDSESAYSLCKPFPLWNAPLSTNEPGASAIWSQSSRKLTILKVTVRVLSDLQEGLSLIDDFLSDSDLSSAESVLWLRSLPLGHRASTWKWDSSSQLQHALLRVFLMLHCLLW